MWCKMAIIWRGVDLFLKSSTNFSVTLTLQHPKLSCKFTLPTIIAATNKRWYRGSNRDTRKREHKLRNKIEKIKNADRKMVFDKKAFMFNNFEKELFCFQKRLNLNFKDADLLKAAFVHPSFIERIKTEEDVPRFTLQNTSLVDELRNLKHSPSRLTLSGLTQTYMLITSNVFKAFPCLSSTLIGEISNVLSGRQTVTRIAEKLGIPELLIIEHDVETIDKEKHIPYSRSDAICDAFFGLMGAILQDLGQEELTNFIDDFIMKSLDEEDFRNEIIIKFPESTASEVAALAGFEEKLEARLKFKASDEADLPLYVIGVFSGNTQLGEAAEATLKKAEDAAFQDVIHSYMWARQQIQSPAFVNKSV